MGSAEGDALPVSQCDLWAFLFYLLSTSLNLEISFPTAQGAKPESGQHG